MESLTPSKRVHLGEVNQKNSRNLIKLIYKQHNFNTLLKLLSINKETYINALQVNFFKPIIFLQRLCKDIWKNPFGIHVGNLWQANTHVQFILDPSAVTSYCTSYLTKIDKTVTKELKNIIISCNENKIETHICVQKMGNIFLMFNKCQHN